MGQQAPGTLQALYPGFMAISAVTPAVIAFGIVRLIRTPVAVADGSPSRSRLRRIAGLAYRGYVDVVIPLAILLLLPGYFGTDWSVMARIEIGQLFLAIAALRIINGAISRRPMGTRSAGHPSRIADLGRRGSLA